MHTPTRASSLWGFAAGLVIILLAGACDAAPSAGGESSLEAAAPGLREPRPGLYTAGQPTEAAWGLAAERGVTKVINLRTAAELQGRDEAGEVAAAGLAYETLPIAGAGDLTEANAARLWRSVEAAPGPALVHCASANRVGALLAIGAAKEGGMSPEKAIEFGRAAGLASLEPQVRAVLEQP